MMVCVRERGRERERERERETSFGFNYGVKKYCFCIKFELYNNLKTKYKYLICCPVNSGDKYISFN